MINRQRFGILLMTSALVGGFMLPAAAAEFTPAPGAAAPAPATAPVAATPAPVAAAPAPVAAAPAPVAATPAPAKTAKATPAIHTARKIVARVAAPVVEPVQQRPSEYVIASTAPTGSQCRTCGYPIIYGVAY
jgi:hypothetical protein